MEQIAIIVYGNGSDLGNFKVFADTLQKELKLKYKKVLTQYINRDTAFFDLIKSTVATEQIAELHIFAHSMGGGIFFGYHDDAIGRMRTDIITTALHDKRKVTYLEAVLTEIGSLQTDDLVRDIFVKQQLELRGKFSKGAFIKIWGCNSGVKDWEYSDGDGSITDPNDKSEPYYWRAFNEKNTPKPSIAQAMATFFNVKAYGATSGTSGEVEYKGKWISTKAYKDKLGKWPSGALPIRLAPDKGEYNEYKP